MKNYKYLLGGLFAASLSIGFVSCGNDDDSAPSNVPNNTVINPKFDFSSALNATDKTVDCGRVLTITVSNCNDALVFVFVDGKLISGNNNVFKLPTDKQGKHEVSITVNSTDYKESYEVKAVAKPEFKFLPATEDETPSVEVGEDLVLNVTNCGDAAVIVFVDGKLISGEKNVFKMPTDEVGKQEVIITINNIGYRKYYEVEYKNEQTITNGGEDGWDQSLFYSICNGTSIFIEEFNLVKQGDTFAIIINTDVYQEFSILIFVNGKRMIGSRNEYVMPTDNEGDYEVSIYIGEKEYSFIYKVLVQLPPCNDQPPTIEDYQPPIGELPPNGSGAGQI